MTYKKIQTRYNVINNLKKRCVQDNKNFTIPRLKSFILYAILTAQKIQKKPPTPLSHRNDGPYRYG